MPRLLDEGDNSLAGGERRDLDLDLDLEGADAVRVQVIFDRAHWSPEGLDYSTLVADREVLLAERVLVREPPR